VRGPGAVVDGKATHTVSKQGFGQPRSAHDRALRAGETATLKGEAAVDRRNPRVTVYAQRKATGSADTPIGQPARKPDIGRPTHETPIRTQGLDAAAVNSAFSRKRPGDLFVKTLKR